MRRALLLLALLAPPALAQDAAQEERDRGFLAGLIEDQLSGSARRVVIEGFEGALSSRATVERLAIADGAGVWLEARDLVLDWNRSALFGGRIEVEELGAGSIAVLRAPVADPAAPSPEATPFALPELPVAVQIGSLRAERVTLGEDLLGEELALTLSGSVDLEGGEGAAVVDAAILDGSEGTLDFDASYSNSTRVLSLDLDLREAEGGLAARALGLPGLPSVALVVSGTAPIDDYEATISLATAGEPRVSGEFALRTTAGPGEGRVVERAFGLDVRGDVRPLLDEGVGGFFGPDVVLRTKGIRRSDGSLVLTSLRVGADAFDLSGEAEITPEGWPARLALAGTVGTEGGGPVPLPGVEGTTVEAATLDVAYDRAAGEGWTGRFAVTGLERPGLRVPDLSLEGGGTIRPATADAPGRFTAALAYAARGLAIEDEGLRDALGTEIAGEVDLVRDDASSGGGGPLRIRRLTLRGPGVEAAGEGTVSGGEAGFEVASSLNLAAADLGRFAALSGLDDLGGSADLTIVSAVRPLDGIFDLALSGGTEDLRLGVPELDALLGGEGTVRVAAARDERGTRITGLDVAAAAASLTGEADITSAESRATFDLRVAELGLVSPDLSGPGRVTGTATRDTVGTIVLDAAADLPGAALEVRASRAAPAEDEGGGAVAGDVTFAVEGDVAEFGDYAALLDRLGAPVAPRGGARLSAAGTAAPDGATFDVSVRAATRDLRLGLARVDPLLAGDGRLRGRVARTGPLSFRVEGFDLRTDLVTATADAEVAGGRAGGTLDVAVAEVAGVLPGLQGPLRVAGEAAEGENGAVALDLLAELPEGAATVDGALEDGAFTGTVDLDLPDLAPFAELARRPLAGGLRGTLAGTVAADPQALDVTVDLAADDLRLGIAALDPLLAGEARVAGTARGIPGGVDLDLAATLAVGETRVDGVWTLGDASGGGAFDGEAAVDFADLAPLGPLVGRDLGGSLRAEVAGTARADLRALDVTFEAATRDLALGVPAADALLRGAGTVSGTAERGPDGLALALTAATPLLAAEAAGTFTGEGGQGRFDVRVADVAPLLPGLSGPASAAGTASQGADGVVALDLDATAPGARAAVDATVNPARGFEVAGTADVAATDLAPYGALLGRPLSGAVEARVEGTALPSFARFDLAVDGTATDLDVGNAVVARLLAGTGTLSAQVARDGGAVRVERLAADFPNLDATASGTAEAVAFDARLADVALLAPGLPGAASARGTARLLPGGAALDVAVAGPGGIQATVAGTVANGAADLAIGGAAPLALLDGVLAPRSVEGPATFDLRLSGPPALSSLSGTVAVEGARLADPGLGTALTGVGGTVTLGAGTATVDLAGSLLDGGRLAVSGPVGLSPPFPADLAIAGEGLVIRDPALYEAVASGRLLLAGPLAGGATLSGTVDVASVEVRVPSSGVGPLGGLPDVFHIEPSVPVAETLRRAGLSADGTDGADAGAAAAGGGGVALDVLVRAPARVFVRGRGLDAELGGELRLAGRTGAIVPSGGLRLLRGRLDLLGQRFTLTEGSATLQGDFEPFLRLVAETEARTGTLVRIVLEGPAREPDVRFESSPELPQDEVLAQLVFGVDLASLSPFQAVQLAAGVSTLAGGGGGLVDDLRSGAGLADLDLTVDAAGNPALRLGRYVTENVYTDVTVGTEDTEATINLDLTPDLTVRAGVDSQGGTSVGIEFGRDF